MNKKTLSLTLIICLAVFGVVAIAAQKESTKSPVKTSESSSQVSAEVIKRGAALGDSPSVALTDVLKEPQKFADKSVLVEGVIERVCMNKGCWMELAPAAGSQEGVRVTFKDYGFFVPVNSQGMKAKAEGQFTVKTLSKEKADHYEGEGARLKRNEDGTATEISFLASGVELRK
ncbi:MAG: DUF4920 domain-containing protein [Acidobacteriota bacterium]|nr:DUF4920 domain-containing protein [Acidobacteriota bacterium]